jgi:hypothetical protein
VIDFSKDTHASLGRDERIAALEAFVREVADWVDASQLVYRDLHVFRDRARALLAGGT